MFEKFRTIFKKRFPITDYLEVVLTKNDKTEIWIKGEHFMQCSHVLTTIHTDEIENLLLLESVDDIKEANTPIVIDPKTRFFVHCSNIQAWVENNFDTRMLHSNLSFPLLKKLVEEGCVDSIILKEEIAKRFEQVSIEMIHFLFDRKYFDSLSNEELSAIVVPNFKTLLKDLLGGSKRDEKLLDYLLKRSLNEELKLILKQELVNDLKNERIRIIRFLVDHNHLDSLALSNDEIFAIIPPNFKLLLKDLCFHDGYHRAIIDYILESSSNENLKSAVIEELARVIEHSKITEKAYTLYYYFHRGYLEYFSNERLFEIISPKFKRLLKDLFRDNIFIDKDRGILRYLLRRLSNEEFKTIIKEEITEIFDQGDSKKIDILIRYDYLDLLSKEDLVMIIKQNLPKIIKMNIYFKNHLFFLNKEELIAVLTNNALDTIPSNMLISLPLELDVLVNILLRRFDDFDFVDFDDLFGYLCDRTSNEKLLIKIVKEQVKSILKENSSAIFLEFLDAHPGAGFFSFLNKEELSALLNKDILHNAKIELLEYLPFDLTTFFNELIRRYDRGDNTVKEDIRNYLDDEFDKENFVDILLLTLFKRYEVLEDEISKNEIKKHINIVLKLDNQRWKDKNELKIILGKDLKNLLHSLSIEDLDILYYDYGIIDLYVYEEAVKKLNLRNHL